MVSCSYFWIPKVVFHWFFLCSARGNSSKLRRICGLSSLFLAFVALSCLLASMVLFAVFLNKLNKETWEFLLDGTLIAGVVLLSTALALFVYPVVIILLYGTRNMPKLRIKKSAETLHKIRFEGKLLHSLGNLLVLEECCSLQVSCNVCSGRSACWPTWYTV